jgi:RNA-splicing ligase RtcB
LGLAYNEENLIESVHNYIDDDNILRKGAISAKPGEKVVIPLNMRDGIILGTGKSKYEYNFSAPHGAGRTMSRTKAKASISLESFQKSMECVFSTCINESTIDESPFAYKPKETIINNIGELVEIEQIIKPIYNFKAN